MHLLRKLTISLFLQIMLLAHMENNLKLEKYPLPVTMCAKFTLLRNLLLILLPSTIMHALSATSELRFCDVGHAAKFSITKFQKKTN